MRSWSNHSLLFLITVCVYVLDALLCGYVFVELVLLLGTKLGFPLKILKLVLLMWMSLGQFGKEAQQRIYALTFRGLCSLP